MDRTTDVVTGKGKKTVPELERTLADSEALLRSLKPGQIVDGALLKCFRDNGQFLSRSELIARGFADENSLLTATGVRHAVLFFRQFHARLRREITARKVDTAAVRLTESRRTVPLIPPPRDLRSRRSEPQAQEPDNPDDAEAGLFDEPPPPGVFREDNRESVSSGPVETARGLDTSRVEVGDLINMVENLLDRCESQEKRITELTLSIQENRRQGTPSGPAPKVRLARCQGKEEQYSLLPRARAAPDVQYQNLSPPRYGGRPQNYGLGRSGVTQERAREYASYLLTGQTYQEPVPYHELPGHLTSIYSKSQMTCVLDGIDVFVADGNMAKLDAWQDQAQAAKMQVAKEQRSVFWRLLFGSKLEGKAADILKSLRFVDRSKPAVVFDQLTQYVRGQRERAREGADFFNAVQKADESVLQYHNRLRDCMSDAIVAQDCDVRVTLGRKILNSLDRRIPYEPHIIERVWDDLQYSEKPLIHVIGVLDKMRDEALTRTRRENVFSNRRVARGSGSGPGGKLNQSSGAGGVLPDNVPSEKDGIPLCKNRLHYGRVIYHVPDNCWFNPQGRAYRPDMADRLNGRATNSGAAPRQLPSQFNRQLPGGQQRKVSQYRGARAARPEHSEDEEVQDDQTGRQGESFWQELQDARADEMLPEQENQAGSDSERDDIFQGNLATFQTVPRLSYPQLGEENRREFAAAVRLGPSPDTCAGRKPPRNVNSITESGKKIPNRLPSCLPTANLWIFDTMVPVLLDTGSSCTICPLSMLTSLWSRAGIDKKTEMKKFVFAPKGDRLNTVGGHISSEDIAFYPMRLTHVNPLDGDTYRVFASVMVINDSKPGTAFGKEFLLGTDLLAPLQCHKLAQFILDYQWTRTCANKFDPSHSNSSRAPKTSLPFGSSVNRAIYNSGAIPAVCNPPADEKWPGVHAVEMVAASEICLQPQSARLVQLQRHDARQNIDWPAQQKKDGALQRVIQTLGRAENPDARFQDGILLHKGLQGFRPWAPAHLRAEMVRTAHEGELGGHAGFHRTFQLLGQFVSWPGMRRDVSVYVDACVTCRKCKHQTGTKFTPLPSKVEVVPFRKVGVDLMAMPKYGKYSSIMTVIDYCTHFAVFFPITSTTSETVADAFLRQVIFRYGVPEQVICDRGSEFVGPAFQKLAENFAYKIHFTLPQNPRANGMAERAHRTLQQILRAQFLDLGKIGPGGAVLRRNWVEELALACFRYNCAVNRATGLAPFQALHGYMPDMILKIGSKIQRVHANVPVEDVDVLREKARAQIGENPTREPTTALQIGDEVFVKQQFGSKLSTDRKIAPLWWGPYTVLAIFNNVVQIEDDSGPRTIPIDCVSRFRPPTPSLPRLPPPDREAAQSSHFDMAPRCFNCKSVAHKEANCPARKEALFDSAVTRMEAIAAARGYNLNQFASWRTHPEVQQLMRHMNTGVTPTDGQLVAMACTFCDKWFPQNVVDLQYVATETVADVLGACIEGPTPLRRDPLPIATYLRRARGPAAASYLAPRGTIFARALKQPFWGKPQSGLAELPGQSERDEQHRRYNTQFVERVRSGQRYARRGTDGNRLGLANPPPAHGVQKKRRRGGGRRNRNRRANQVAAQLQEQLSMGNRRPDTAEPKTGGAWPPAAAAPKMRSVVVVPPDQLHAPIALEPVALPHSGAVERARRQLDFNQATASTAASSANAIPLGQAPDGIERFWEKNPGANAALVAVVPPRPTAVVRPNTLYAAPSLSMEAQPGTPHTGMSDSDWTPQTPPGNADVQVSPFAPGPGPQAQMAAALVHADDGTLADPIDMDIDDEPSDAYLPEE